MTNLIAQLQQARKAAAPATISLADLPTTLQQAYQVSRAQIDVVAGWKIGGANPWSRAVFDNSVVFFGPLAPHELCINSASLDISALHAPLAEPEIMLELAEPGAGDPAQQFSRLGLGFEIPASVLPEDAKATLHGQIADRAGAGGLWIGAIQAFDAALLTTPFETRFQHNDEPAVVGSSANVIGGPLAAAQEFLQLAQSYDMPLRAGQWLATGGVNPAVAVTAGDRLDFTALNRRVRLTLG